MTLATGIVLCLAYLLGLLSTAVPIKVAGLSLGGVGVLILAIAAGKRLPRRGRTFPKLKVWVAAGVVGLLASLYLQIRAPHPDASDISRLLPTNTPDVEVLEATVQGRLLTPPRLTRSQRSQFWMRATFAFPNAVGSQEFANGQKVTGKVYVTVPLLQATGLRPGQAISVEGVLYQPKPALNPGGFDFREYLAQEGGFAGLKGRRVTLPEGIPIPQKGWWAVRQRIVQAQLQWVNLSEGLLISSMVLGGRVVDLPYAVRDQFTRIGLSHALAASGFQVSLILSAVLMLTASLSRRWQFGLGIASLLIFLGLTGIQASVLRAVVMGVGALVAMLMERKTRPINGLLLAAVGLLLFQPAWIWDLGFQLSFLATLGLLVTVPPLTQRLDWLPPLVATAVAVPLSAYIWTLPLQLHAFGVVSPYSLLVNVITTPLITVISLGGFISAIAALIWPLLGSVIAWGLSYPAHLLIAVVEWFNLLPGNITAVGTISLLQLLFLYGLIGLVWWRPRWHHRWWVALIMGISLIAIPAWQMQRTLFQLTVLSTADQPVLVIRDQGQVTLFNSGSTTTAQLTILPFLHQQGINRLTTAIATQPQLPEDTGWLQILQQLPITAFYQSAQSAAKSPTQSTLTNLIQVQGTQPLPPTQPIQTHAVTLQPLEANPRAWQFSIRTQRWLHFSNLKIADQVKLALSGQVGPVQVLWWSGEPLSLKLIEVAKPAVAIASTRSIDADTLSLLKENNTQVYWTGRDGAIQWTPANGFESVLEPGENNASGL